MRAMLRSSLVLAILLAAVARADDPLPRGAKHKMIVTEDGEGTLWSAAFSPDGKWLACGGSVKKIHLWDVESGEHLRSFGDHPDAVWTVAFSPDGKLLCSGGRGDLTLRVWDPTNGEELKPFEGHRGGITGIKFFRDGKRLIMSGGSWDPTIRIWDVAKREQLFALTGHGNLIDSMDLASNGRLAISGSRDGSLRIWSLATGKQLRVQTNPGEEAGYAAVGFSPDGRFYATGTYDGQFQVRETLSFRRCLPLRERQGSVHAIAFSPDGKLVAFGGQSRAIEILDLRTGDTIERFKGHQGQIRALAFSKDGKFLASAGTDAMAMIWKVPPAPNLTKRLSDAERVEAWDRLASDNPVMARHGVAALANDSGGVLDFLAARLKPAPAIDERPLRQSVAQLDGPKFADRERAHHALEQAGELAAPVLQQALAAAKTLEARKRLERLLERIEKLEPGAAQRQALRAIAVLEQHGGDAAKQLLDQLAGGAAGARVTIEAKDARERMH